MTLRACPWRPLTAGLFLLTSCFTSSLAIRNETPTALVPYPVVTSPPPPHREADPAASIAPNAEQEIDPEGFNPVYYAGPVDGTKPNGVFLGLALYHQDPPQIQYRIFHYAVAPGQEGTDPALQPTLLREDVLDLTDDDYVVRVIRKQADVPSAQWEVVAEKIN